MWGARIIIGEMIIREAKIIVGGKDHYSIGYRIIMGARIIVGEKDLIGNSIILRSKVIMGLRIILGVRIIGVE